MDKNYIKFDKSISIIIPLRNKEATIILTLDELKKRLQKISYEIIIIENGSTDNSYQIAKNWCTENKHIETILTTSDVGLGNALKVGIERSNNEYIWTVGADMQFGTSDFESLIDNYSPDVKMYIGSRQHKDSEVVREKYRASISRVFIFLKTYLIGSKIKDTMGSFIGDASLLKKYCTFPKTTEFFYVTELVSIFEVNNLKILELPVKTLTSIDLHEGNTSTVNFLTTPIKIFLNLISLRFRLKKNQNL